MFKARAFTLIELLVVVTIIVVLLALLTPALDQAIYQTELAVCGANQRATASGVTLYATGNRRSYPHRPGVRDDVGWITFQIYNGSAAFQAVANGGRSNNAEVFDDRILLRTFLSLNDSLNDPLTGKLDFEDVDTDTAACASYNLWFGYRYKGHKGMYRIGDRMTWQDTPNWGPNIYKGVWKFDLLIGDVESNNTNLGPQHRNTRASHPDKSAILADTVVQNGAWGLFGPTAKFTLSFWESNQGRGAVDLNFGSQDGSVQRYTDVECDSATGKDERMAYVPAYNMPQQWQTAMPPQK